MSVSGRTEYGYHQTRPLTQLPRLPLAGSLDLTYRCNNHCRHCWLRLPVRAREGKKELSLEELLRIAGEARAMGCREWHLSGGEPMLRPDFSEIFAFLTRQSRAYTLNTNGTLITPEIARLLKRPGSKLVVIYGATAPVHDHITRTPGSFEAAMQGLAYLKEAGAGFTVQIIPMRDNYHQFDDMVNLAMTLSPHYRIGAAWLYLSACGSARRNAEIARQRLDPREVVRLDQPDPSYDDWLSAEEASSCRAASADDRLLAPCIAHRREFHLDPYGGMTFCCFVKDPALRYDLRTGSFREAWESFIPSLADKVRGGREYLEHCAACRLRQDCRWCDVYGYLEHGRHGAPVEYLCRVARETRHFKEDWCRRHRRYFSIGGLTVQVETDLPITDDTFAPKFQEFAVDRPEGDVISIRHHFSLPDLKGRDLGRQVYRKPPWAIYRESRSWIYLGISPDEADNTLHQVAVFSDDHSRGKIYNPDEDTFRKGGLQSLTSMPTDQILLARILADRQGCFLHAAGAIVHGQGLIFVGHSGAGKSTMVKFLQERARILCDDRVIVRRWPEGFKIHGSWSHGEVPLVSNASAPLRAVLFLEKSRENRLMALTEPREMLGRLLACLIKPLATGDWWEKTLALAENIIREVPSYLLEFDLSGEIVSKLEHLVQEAPPAGGGAR